MKLTIKLFATLKEHAHANFLELEVAQEQLTVAELLEEINKQAPHLNSALKSALVAVNKEFAFSGQVIHPGDEIAMFPPVSGGCA